MSTRRRPDKTLLQALVKAYTARARLFHEGVVASQIDLLIEEIDAVHASGLRWDLKPLGITSSAREKVLATGADLHQVFAHPALLKSRPYLIGYYRNIATISKKGIGQILFPTSRYEERTASEMKEVDARELCKTLNSIISGVIDALPAYDVSLSRKAIFAEVGSQLQGTWANVVGQGASKAVEGLLAEYVAKKRLGRQVRQGAFVLGNGWQIVFGTEPDVSFKDASGNQQIAVEIKGSLDVAGAQTRYGEAKKSFAKQLADNPRCHTIYLASCFTDAVIRQIKADGQVRDWFNLTSVLYDKAERERFLQRLFHIVKTSGG